MVKLRMSCMFHLSADSKERSKVKQSFEIKCLILPVNIIPFTNMHLYLTEIQTIQSVASSLLLSLSVFPYLPSIFISVQLTIKCAGIQRAEINLKCDFNNSHTHKQKLLFPVKD